MLKSTSLPLYTYVNLDCYYRYKPDTPLLKVLSLLKRWYTSEGPFNWEKIHYYLTYTPCCRLQRIQTLTWILTININQVHHCYRYANLNIIRGLTPLSRLPSRDRQIILFLSPLTTYNLPFLQNNPRLRVQDKHVTSKGIPAYRTWLCFCITSSSP